MFRDDKMLSKNYDLFIREVQQKQVQTHLKIRQI